MSGAFQLKDGDLDTLSLLRFICLPEIMHAPTLLIRLGRLEVHPVAAMRFGLVPVEDSDWKYTFSCECEKNCYREGEQ